MVTTIQIEEKTKAQLQKLKVHERESYNAVLKRVLQKQETEDIESLRETLEILSDPMILRDIAQGMKDIEEGNIRKL
jgi:predicted CopG family antitoxin